MQQPAGQQIMPLRQLHWQLFVSSLQSGSEPLHGLPLLKQPPNALTLQSSVPVQNMRSSQLRGEYAV